MLRCYCAVVYLRNVDAAVQLTPQAIHERRAVLQPVLECIKVMLEIHRQVMFISAFTIFSA